MIVINPSQEIIKLSNIYIDSGDNFHLWHHNEPEYVKSLTHMHTYIELELLLEGKGINSINGVNLSLNKGSLCIIPPLVSHTIEFSENSHLITVSFSENIIKYSAIHRDIKTNIIYCDLDENELTSISKALDDIQLIKNHPGKLAEEAISARFNAILIEILRKSKIYNPYDLDESIPNKLSKAVAYINANSNKNISLPIIAEYVEMSPNHLGVLFKKHLGISYSSYLESIRLEHSKILLLDDSLSIANISKIIGFNSPSYFMYCFKSTYNTTPGKYRKMYIK